MTEASPAGTGYLAAVSLEWEEASGSAARKGIRVVSLRIGVVLSPKGGALSRMLPLYRRVAQPIARSATLVPVGPVTTRSPNASKNGYASLFSR